MYTVYTAYTFYTVYTVYTVYLTSDIESPEIVILTCQKEATNIVYRVRKGSTGWGGGRGSI
jgi:hypothetical protein